MKSNKLEGIKHVAIKAWKKDETHNIGDYLQELLVNTEIKRTSTNETDSLLRMIGACPNFQPNEFYEVALVFPLHRQGDLESFIERQTELTNDWIVKMALCAAKGFAQLHKLDWVHRDIKHQNILVGASETYHCSLDEKESAIEPSCDNVDTLKISDFGNAKVKGHQQDSGSSDLVAEQLLRTEFGNDGVSTTQSDVILYGFAMFQMLRYIAPSALPKKFGVDDFQSCVYSQFVDDRLQNFENHFNRDEKLKKFWALIIWCCHCKPTLRPKMELVVEKLEQIQCEVGVKVYDVYGKKTNNVDGNSSPCVNNRQYVEMLDK